LEKLSDSNRLPYGGMALEDDERALDGVRD
jgi:hypothetical protein